MILSNKTMLFDIIMANVSNEDSVDEKQENNVIQCDLIDYYFIH